MSDAGLGVFIPSALAIYGGVGRVGRSLRQIGPITATVTIEEKHHDELVITDHPVELGSTISDHAFRKPSTVTLRVSWSTSPAGSQGQLGGVLDVLNGVLQGQVANLASKVVNRAIGGSGVQPAIGNIINSGIIAAGVGAFSQITNTGVGQGTSSLQDVYQSLLNLQSSVTPFDLYTGKRIYKNMLIRSITVETDKTSENALNALLELQEVILVETTITSVNTDPASQSDGAFTLPVKDNGVVQLLPLDATTPQLATLLPPKGQ